ncbi:MAG: ceramidase domain-containing protein [Methylocystis sp.]
MAWSDPVVDYCERRGHDFWSEPVNALTNLAFLAVAAAAFASWRGRRADYPALALIVVTALVGVGSFIFHTVATRGAMLFDVIPIAVFIYGYFLLALRRFFGLGALAAGAITLLFAAGSYFAETSLPRLHGSVGYLPALGAMMVFAALAWPRARETARTLALAAATFAASLAFRTMDGEVCAAFPLGTHFLWHLLNACVLGLLLRAAMLAAD